MIDGCSVLPYERNILMPSFVAPFRHRDGNGRAAEPAERHEREVLVGEVRMVEQAREEVRRAAADTPRCSSLHHPQDLARVPHVDEVDGAVTEQRDEERVDHADEVTDRRAGDLRRPARRGRSSRAGGSRTRSCGASG